MTLKTHNFEEKMMCLWVLSIILWIYLIGCRYFYQILWKEAHIWRHLLLLAPGVCVVTRRVCLVTRPHTVLVTRHRRHRSLVTRDTGDTLATHDTAPVFSLATVASAWSLITWMIYSGSPGLVMVMALRPGPDTWQSPYICSNKPHSLAVQAAAHTDTSHQERAFNTLQTNSRTQNKGTS